MLLTAGVMIFLGPPSEGQKKPGIELAANLAFPLRST